MEAFFENYKFVILVVAAGFIGYYLLKEINRLIAAVDRLQASITDVKNHISTSLSNTAETITNNVKIKNDKLTGDFVKTLRNLTSIDNQQILSAYYSDGGSVEGGTGQSNVKMGSVIDKILMPIHKDTVEDNEQQAEAEVVVIATATEVTDDTDGSDGNSDGSDGSDDSGSDSSSHQPVEIKVTAEGKELDKLRCSDEQGRQCPVPNKKSS